MDEAKNTGVDVQILSPTPGGVTTFDATSVTTYPSGGQPMPGSLPGGSGGPGWGPAWPYMVPQTPVIVVTVDKKGNDKKESRAQSEVFKRP